MCGLLILKQINDCSDDTIISLWLLSPYYQKFCGEMEFKTKKPCDSTDIVKFRQRIGVKGVSLIFAQSVSLHKEQAEEATVLVDTTVQEKAITYPTDNKLAIKIINSLNKLAKTQSIKQRRTYAKEVKELRLSCRNFRHAKRRTKAKKALKRLRTIAGTLIRELERKLSSELLNKEKKKFKLYRKVLTQQPKDKNKIYSLHEPDIYCVGKGKDHKPYEYGRKASIATTLKSNIIVGVVSHNKNEHDSKTLKETIDHANSNRQQPVSTAVVDRGYKGCKNKVDVEVIIPGKALKKDSKQEKKRKSNLCKRRSAIEPIIGHLKHNFRLARNWLKGSVGDEINLLMAASAWNFRKWMTIFFLLYFSNLLLGLLLKINMKKTKSYSL